MYVCMCLCTSVYVCVRACTNISNTHVCVYTSKHAFVRTEGNLYKHTYTYRYTYVCVYNYIDIRICVYVHVHAWTYSCIHIYTYICYPPPQRSMFFYSLLCFYGLDSLPTMSDLTYTYMLPPLNTNRFMQFSPVRSSCCCYHHDCSYYCH